MEGRVSSAIHRVNNDPETSTIKKCENSGIEFSSCTKRALTAADRDADSHRNYAKRSEVVNITLLYIVTKFRLILSTSKLTKSNQTTEIESWILFHLTVLMELFRKDLSDIFFSFILFADEFAKAFADEFATEFGEFASEFATEFFVIFVICI